MGRVRVDKATLQPYQRGPWYLRPSPGNARSLRRHHEYDGASDLDLVALLQPLGREDAAPVEPGAVGGVEVFGVPVAMGGLEEGVLAGGVLIADDQRALPARGEFGVEDAGIVADLDDDRLGAPAFGEGGV